LFLSPLGPCDAGYYCPSTSPSIVATSIPCGSVLFYCPTNSSSPQSASLGHYTTNQDGSNVGTQTIRVNQTRCGVGTYCINGERITCPQGTYQSNSGRTNCNDCSPGEKASGFGSAVCDICVAGTYSAAAARSCSSCPSGTYSPSNGSIICTTCDQGYMSLGGASYCTACSIGSFSPSSSLSFCIQCNFGYYSDANASSTCQPCQAGRFGSRMSLNTSLCSGLCPAGQYSVSGQTACQNCSTGWFSNAGSSTCQICNSGSYSLTGATACVICGPGSFASSSSLSSCSLCSAGAYSNINGSTFCSPCDSGKYGSIQGLGSTSCSGTCAPGTYSLASSSSCTNCSAGSASTTSGSSYCDTCGVGRFATTGSPLCRVCPLGKFAAGSSLTTCTVCQAGTYQNGSNPSTCLPCAAGKYGSQAGIDSDSCSGTCRAGSYSVEGSTSCTNCSGGSISLISGSSSCEVCPMGSYSREGWSLCSICDSGRYSPSERLTGCTDCQIGFYQPLPGRDKCIKCSSGNYTDVIGSSICSQCSSGRYSLEGSPTCTNCSAGYYASNAQSNECTACNKGSYAILGQSNCTLCEAGKFGSSDGLSSCTECAVGTYSDRVGSSECTSCATGLYGSSKGLLSSSCTGRCRNGTYSTLGAKECTNCSNGFVSNGASGTCSACDLGKYAESGDAQCRSCDIGKYGVTTGLSACIDCSIGYYSEVKGASVCISCPAGYYGDTTGLTSANCSGLCDAGYWCPLGSTSSKQAECGASVVFCPEGSALPQSAPLGSYPSVGESTTKYTSISICPAGSYCNGQISLCPAGQYQDEINKSYCKDCLPGTYSGTAGATNCTTCDVRTYQPSSGSKSCITCATGLSVNGSHTSCDATQCNPGEAVDELDGCQPCASGKASSDGYSCVTCSEGTYNTKEGSSTCYTCASGLSCVTGEAVLAAEKWGSVDVTTGKIVTSSCPKCSSSSSSWPPTYPCGENSNRIQNLTNLLCGECITDYYEWNGNCINCTPPYGGYLTLTFLLSWAYVIIIHRLAQAPQGPTTVFFFFVQIAVLMSPPASDMVNWMQVFNFQPQESSSSYRCIYPLDAYGKLAVSVLSPAVFMVELLITMVAHKLWSLTANPASCFAPFRLAAKHPFDAQPYWRTWLSLFLFSYTQLTSTVVSHLRCVDVGSESVVYASPSIRCTSTTYKAWKVILILILCFDTCLAPVIIAALVLGGRCKQGKGCSERTKTRILRRLSILFEAFKDEASWWQSWILVRRTLFVAFDNTFLSDLPTKYMAFSFVILASVLANAYWQPYKLPTVNAMEAISQCLLLILSIFLTSVTSGTAPYSEGVTAFVFVIVGVPTCCFMAFIVYLKFQQCGARRKAKALGLTNGTTGGTGGTGGNGALTVQMASNLRVRVPVGEDFDAHGQPFVHHVNGFVGGNNSNNNNVNGTASVSNVVSTGAVAFAMAVPTTPPHLLEDPPTPNVGDASRPIAQFHQDRSDLHSSSSNSNNNNGGSVLVSMSHVTMSHNGVAHSHHPNVNVTATNPHPAAAGIAPLPLRAVSTNGNNNNVDDELPSYRRSSAT
jgi:hypothetical protein